MGTKCASAASRPQAPAWFTLAQRNASQVATPSRISVTKISNRYRLAVVAISSRSAANRMRRAGSGPAAATSGRRSGSPVDEEKIRQQQHACERASEHHAAQRIGPQHRLERYGAFDVGGLYTEPADDLAHAGRQAAASTPGLSANASSTAKHHGASSPDAAQSAAASAGLARIPTEVRRPAEFGSCLNTADSVSGSDNLGASISQAPGGGTRTEVR